MFMAHIGRLDRLRTISRHSFVPAESAVIGITDKILTRVQTRESVSKVLDAREMSNVRLRVRL